MRSHAAGGAISLPTDHVYVLRAPYELEMTDRQQQLRDQVARLLGIAAGADALADEMEGLRGASTLLPGRAKDLIDAMDELLTATSEAGLADIADDLALDLHPVADDGANSAEAIDQVEKPCLASLQTPRRMGAGMEDVTVYGIQEGSRYWTDVDVSDGRVMAGAGLLEKCGLRVGGTIVLHDMKVFGYRDREIRRLYLSSITLAVTLSLVLSLPLTMWCVRAVTDAIMFSYSGNFVMTFAPTVVAEDLAIGFGSYLAVALLHMRRIRRVPLELALKTQE